MFIHTLNHFWKFISIIFQILIDDRNASIYYNRKCARKPISVRFGCHDEDIEIQGEGTYKGRICYCDPTKDGDLCNTETQIPINGTELFWKV